MIIGSGPREGCVTHYNIFQVMGSCWYRGMVCDKLWTSGSLHQLVSLVTPGRCTSLHFMSPNTQPVVRTVHNPKPNYAEHPQDQFPSSQCGVSLAGIATHHRVYPDLTTQPPKPDSALTIQTAPRDWADCVRELPAGSSSSWSLGWTTAINVGWPTETSSWKIRCCRCVLFCLPIPGNVCVSSALRLEGRHTGIRMPSLVCCPIKSWT